MANSSPAGATTIPKGMASTVCWNERRVAASAARALPPKAASQMAGLSRESRLRSCSQCL